MIAGIYRINRPAEKNNFEECGIKHNRQMLWHGTERENMLGVLKHGLKMDATNGNLIRSNFGSVSLDLLIAVFIKLLVSLSFVGLWLLQPFSLKENRV